MEFFYCVRFALGLCFFVFLFVIFSGTQNKSRLLPTSTEAAAEEEPRLGAGFSALSSLRLHLTLAAFTTLEKRSSASNGRPVSHSLALSRAGVLLLGNAIAKEKENAAAAAALLNKIAKLKKVRNSRKLTQSYLNSCVFCVLPIIDRIRLSAVSGAFGSLTAYLRKNVKSKQIR